MERVLYMRKSIMKWVSYITTFVIVLVTMNYNSPANITYAEEELELYALSAVLMDADSGRIFFGKEEDIKICHQHGPLYTLP